MAALDLELLPNINFYDYNGWPSWDETKPDYKEGPEHLAELVEIDRSPRGKRFRRTKK